MLEVIALSVDDARAALDGGADRIELVGTMAMDGLSPELSTVEAIRERVGIPVRAMLRFDDGFGYANAHALTRRAAHYAELGVDGIVLGFLRGGEVDHEIMRRVIDAAQVPYTFHRAVDHANDYAKAWQDIEQLGGKLTDVLTAGGAHGVGNNLSRLTAAAKNTAPLILAGGGLQEEHVPVLAGAGVGKFHVGSRVRPDGDFTRTIDSRLVEKWRELILREARA